MAPERPVNRNFIRALPKAELHLHLEGTLAPETLAELSARHDSSPLTLEGARQIYAFEGFGGFLQAFKTLTQWLRTAEDYELITYRMIEQLAAQGVVHAEVTCSAGVVLWRGLDFDAIFAGMERGRERGQRDFGVSVLWILDAVRHFGVEHANAVLDATIRHRDRNVVAFGIGGDEQKAPPEMFRDVFARARDHGLRLTAHAGEAAGPQSIWGAINIGAERIGHGLNAWQDPELIDILAERQIPIEICMTSNLRTGCCTSLDRHPVRAYFDRGLMLTLNSDDPAVFGSNLIQEYELAQQAFGFTQEHLRELARNSIEASFLPTARKLELLDAFDSAESPR